MKLVAILAILSLQACATATVTSLVPREALEVNCPVLVYPDKPSAMKDGEIQDEVCLVDGRGPSLTAAIHKARKQVCRCGTNYAYIRDSAPESLIKSGSVTLVGITYKDGK